MNKRGFTLAELLGVIIILGVIALIVFPVVNNSIKSSREKAYEEQKNIVIRSAKSWGVKNSNQLSRENATYVTIEQLIQGGYIEKKKVINPVTEQEMDGCIVIRYNSTFNRYDYEYSEASCEEEQGDRPIITMNGDSSVYIVRNSVYEDEGAIGTYRGSDITGSISISNTVDTSQIGTYYVKYNLVYDGKSAVEVVRTVIVECPSITLMNSTVKSCDTMTNDPDGNLRFVGSNPNNYVKFNNTLWRIIGEFGGQAKIVQDEYYSRSVIWNTNSNSDWNNSSLQVTLNNEFLNSIESVSLGYVDLSYEWNIGGVTSSYSNTRSQFYSAERGTEVVSGNLTTWVGAIGLMYPSDYAYSTSAMDAECDSTDLGSWSGSGNVKNCRVNSWLYDSGTLQWTLSPYYSTYNSSYVYTVYSSGLVSNLYVSNPYGVRPVLYLNSNVKITGGTGTSSDPFILGM